MKIVYIHQYYVTPAMQGGTRSYELARRLAAAGHEVHIVTSLRDASRPAVERRHGKWLLTTDEGVAVHWYPVPYSNKMPFGARVRAFVAFAAASSIRAVQLGGDILFATSTPLTVAIPGIIASKINSIPMVFEVRDLWPELPIAIGAIRNPFVKAAARLLERSAYFSSARVVALSPGMRDGVVATGYPSSRVEVIPNACDFEMFDKPLDCGLALRASLPWLGARPLILYAGTLGQINGVGYLARLARACVDMGHDVAFAVVGTGKEEAEVRSLASDLGVLDRNFFLLGSQPKSRIPEFMSAATACTSLFIDLPAMWSNSANKFFDTLAAGRPVVINYSGWHADHIRQHDAGLVLDPHDLQGSARLLCQALSDPAWLQRAGSNAQELGRTMFDRDTLASRLERLLAQVHAEARRAPPRFWRRLGSRQS